MKILLRPLEGFVGMGEKTLVYFPLVTLIGQFGAFANLYGSPALRTNLVRYYGPLEKDEKQANYVRFKSNDAIIMLATKAFGMGIDIPDIKNIYHFAPTANVCDYVQEIGRAARQLDVGFAYFDYLPHDFSYVNRLHGISTLRKHQLVQVMEKIHRMAEIENFPRHLLTNSAEFRHIFTLKTDDDSMSTTNSRRRCWLSKGTLVPQLEYSPLEYSPIVARPRSLFAIEYFKMDAETAETILRSSFRRYFSRVGKTNANEILYDSVFSVDMTGIWENAYRSFSFTKFKYLFHSVDAELSLNFLANLWQKGSWQVVIVFRARSSVNLLCETLDNIAE